MKPINMGSSFEDLDVRILKVKMVRNLNKRLSRYFIKMNLKNLWKTHPPRPSLSSVISTLLPLATHGEHGYHFIGKFWHHNAQHVTCGKSF
jgi:hypothetical protein